MTLPFIKVEQVNGTLAVSPEQTDQIVCVMGAASLAPKNTLLAFTSVSKLVEVAGEGRGVAACAEQIVDTGVGYLICPTLGVTGVAGSVSDTGTSPAITVSGDPNDDYRVEIEITKGGALGTATAKVSLDDGNTWLPDVVLASTVVIPGTGLTLGCAAGTYVKGDTASFDCDGPYFSTANLATAGAALLADQREFGTLLVAGRAHGADAAAKATACAAMASAISTFMATANQKKRYFRTLLESPDIASSALKTAFTSFVDPTVLVMGIFEDVQSPATQRVEKRSIGGTYAARIGRIPVHKHPGEVRKGPGRGGALPSRVKKLYADEDTIADLDAARFVTFCEILGKTGVFVTRGPTMDAPDGLFTQHQYCRVADLASKVTRDALGEWFNTDLAIKGDGTGQMTAAQVAVIDADLTKRVRAAIVDPGYASDAKAAVDPSIDTLNTSAFEGDTFILRKGYAEYISWRVGFVKEI